MNHTQRSGTQKAGVHVALLRGINVGGKNKLSMKDLAAVFGDAGCSDVQTYIQSGNVVFRTSATFAARVPARIAEAIAERFGLRVPVLTRSAEELRKLARANPFLREGVDPATLHVAFLADLPSAANIAALDPDRSPPDRFSLHGREVYLHCPNGFARTKLGTDYLDARLATTSTVRNWNTVLRLVELAGG